MIVAARNEADRIGATLDALRAAFSGRASVVADDASTDGTAEVALRRGRRVVSRGRPHGKGAQRDRRGARRRSASRRRRRPGPALRRRPRRLGRPSSRRWSRRSRRRVRPRGRRLRRRAAAASASRSASPAGRSERRCGLERAAPISGPARDARPTLLRALLPFAAGFGMEIGMTIDAVRAGYRVARGRARPRAPRHRPHARRLPAPRPPARATSCASVAPAPAG